ncbi:28S ribosomal protein S9, mitochondrial isoform X2 [Bombyx mandarina]|uniref:Small ribosomal subunit protein uS9m n=2 Tax=Bombyx TaxID=7090 RepID=A0A8R1WJH6_BOMMO|nr:28S ribosomal protein S9, mitochondrial [Bombyx mori]XP_028031544.1 28S ribosomal protein S9, mitochondrial isoform X1 [Bombyx mandarina]XP_028031553.1 28S ribosomal protein S9, mitochondrial isoform X2 [Bombyx mandarina]
MSLIGIRQIIPAATKYFRYPLTIGTFQYCTRTTSDPSNVLNDLTDWETLNKKKKISKAMKAYLERAKEHDEFMKRQQFEYNIGKRHLANMMGEDPELFTQKDVERAIEYLFPSGIYDPAARPSMRPPEDVFPARKAAEFDEAGRPHHCLFYTGKPNFFKLLHDAADHLQQLYKYEDQVIRKKATPDPNGNLQLGGSMWVNKDQLEQLLVEKISDLEYDNFKVVMERLVSLPYSYRYKDFIEKFRKPLAVQKFALEIPKPNYDEEGRAYITTYECLRKKARGDVTIRSPGTGKITINKKDITYFDDVQSREQVLFPLIFTGMQNRVDVECNVEGGGPSGQSGAIRWGIAWGLRSFVDKDMLQQMQVAGLLTRDHRRRERKKPGQPGARKKPTWKKR